MTDDEHSEHDEHDDSEEQSDDEEVTVPAYANATIPDDDWKLGWAIFAAANGEGMTALYKSLVKSKDAAIVATLKNAEASSDLAKVLAGEEGDITDADKAKAAAKGMMAILDKINDANKATGDTQTAEVTDKLAELAVELSDYVNANPVLSTTGIVSVTGETTSLGDLVITRLEQGGCNNIFYESVASTVSAVAEHGPSMKVAIQARLKEAGVTV